MQKTTPHHRFPPSENDPTPLTIGLVGYNSKEVLTHSLARAYEEAQSLGCDFLFFDNNSSDGSAEYIKKNFPKIKIYSAPSNLGFATAHNFLAKQSQAKYYLCLNPDIYLEKGSLKKLIQHAEKQTDFFALQPLLLRWPDPTQSPKINPQTSIDSAGLHFKSNGKVTDHIANTPYKKPIQNKPIQGCTGALALFHREKFLDLGGFESSFFAYKEDVYLALKSNQKNYKSYLFGEPLAWHIRSVKSLKNRSEFQNYLSYRNHFPVVKLGKTLGLFKQPQLILREHFRLLYFFLFRRNVYKQVQYENKYSK